MKNPRRKKTQAIYDKFKGCHAENPSALEVFNFQNEVVLHTFEHWIIIENRFPYDQIAKVNHMIVSKRPLQSHYNGTKAEQKEYRTIIMQLEKEGFYDAYIENFSKVKSVKKFAHTHLVIWRQSKKLHDDN